MNNNERMISNSPEKGRQRYQIIRDAISRYNEAIKAGYYLEAITLVESLIADRLESRAIFLGLKDSAFLPLGKLCIKLKGDALLSEVITDTKQWAKSRNDALHALAKIKKGNNESFQEKYDATKTTAKEGILIFRKLDSLLKESRKSK